MTCRFLSTFTTLLGSIVHLGGTDNKLKHFIDIVDKLKMLGQCLQFDFQKVFCFRTALEQGCKPNRHSPLSQIYKKCCYMKRLLN